MLTAVVGGVPATHQMLGERIGVETMYVHIVHIAEDLQLGITQLRSRVDTGCFGRVCVNLLVNLVRAGSEAKDRYAQR